MNIVLIRTVILYLVVNISLRIMGKRQLGELQPSEFVVALLIADLAAIPIQEPGIPLIYGIVPIFTLLSMEVIISFITLKSCKIRELMTGKPSIVIHNGMVNQREMKRLRLNMDDLLSELRQNGLMNISDVGYAIIETNGKLAIFPKASKCPLTPADIGQYPEDQKLPHIIVCGGKVRKKALSSINRDKKWLDFELSSRGVNDLNEVLLMTSDESGKVFIINEEVKSK